MKGTKTKVDRNKQLVLDKQTMSFSELAKKYRISAKRAKDIYYKYAALYIPLGKIYKFKTKNTVNIG